MSLIEIEFLNIQNETTRINEDLSLEESFETKRDTMDFNEYDMKCGEIFISNSGKFTLICTLCEENFENMQIFDEHMQAKHLHFNHISPVEIQPSPVNNHPETSFDSTNQEADYIEDSAKWVYDDLSNYSASEPRSIVSDHRDAESEPTPKWFCEICLREYKTKSSLSRHYKCHEKSDGSPTKKSPTPELNKKKHSIENDSDYLKCKYCSEEFLDRKETLEHELTHDRSKPYTCPHCPKVFRYKVERQMHINIHTGERPYKCSRCPQAFATKNYLGQHIRTHLGIKKYMCDVCGKGFIRNVERNIHMRVHTGEKPYQCEECGINFMGSAQLWHHRKRHTNNKNHKCDICGSMFYLNKHLKEHQIVHSDARPYECHECNRRFPRLKALISHKKIHSDIKEYVCDICKKAFAQAAGLYSHKRSHRMKMGLS